jgi:hypothetical protein
MSSSALLSLIELVGFFVVAVGLGVHQLWALKKLELLRLKHDRKEPEFPPLS